MKDKELEALEKETEKAWEATINALANVINCITLGRNYYRDKCVAKEEQKDESSDNN